jgi:hypothetical protein
MKRLKFIQPIGKFAKIEGLLTSDGENLYFELAMTETVGEPVKGIIKRALPMMRIEEITIKRRLFKKSLVTITSKTLEAFKKIPGTKGFDYTINSTHTHKETQSFVNAIRFEMAQAETEYLTKLIDDELSGGETPP